MLSDAALLAETIRVAGIERQSTADLIALLAEVDSRKLYLGQGHQSLFAWCTEVLHLSESAAYSRITAARVSRRFPVLLSQLADGWITLTAVGLLAAHLTDENHQSLLEAARHKSKREIEYLVACLDPQPDVAASVRRLPGAPASRPSSFALLAQSESADGVIAAPDMSAQSGPQVLTKSAPVPAQRCPVLAPLSAERYLLKVTLSQDAHAKLERIQDLLRHSLPNGDPAAIVERALAALLLQLEETKLAGENGRCRATGFLEFHHVVPFARGGPTSVENLQLRCRAHNAYEAERMMGTTRLPLQRENSVRTELADARRKSERRAREESGVEAGALRHAVPSADVDVGTALPRCSLRASSERDRDRHTFFTPAPGARDSSSIHLPRSDASAAGSEHDEVVHRVVGRRSRWRERGPRRADVAR